jgi:pilus assembly protein CpaC
MIGPSLLGRGRIAATCLIAAVVATNSPPAAAQVTNGSVQVRGASLGTNLNVPINKSQVVEADRDFSTVSVGNPDIADVIVLGPRTGRQYGATSVTLSDDEDQIPEAEPRQAWPAMQQSPPTGMQSSGWK